MVLTMSLIVGCAFYRHTEGTFEGDDIHASIYGRGNKLSGQYVATTCFGFLRKLNEFCESKINSCQ